MANNSFFGRWYTKIFKPTESETTYLHKGEILSVFLVGFFIAIVMWLLINLGRDYTITLEVPLVVEGESEEMAFAEQPPESARVSVSGEGWNLLPIWRNPPRITIAYDEGMVNISSIIQDQLSGYPDLTVHEVVPPYINVEVEPRVSKRVPVRSELEVDFESRFEIVGDIRVSPDSITVTGAESILDTISYWPTTTIRLRNVQNGFSREVALADQDMQVALDTNRVRVSFDVTELTEGEIRVYVRARNIPEDRQIRFNPSVITIRYDVPIESFSEAQDIVPYEAFVDYEDILRDTTGYMIPTVRPTTDDLDLRLRSFQPQRVSYFHVIGD